MLFPAKRGATYQDVLDAPEGMRAELIGDELYLQPRPRVSHQIALSRLDRTLGAFEHSVGRTWLILSEVEIHIPFTLVPDLSGWRRERVVEPVDSPYFTIVPDWVCEVLSPSTRAYDRGLKARKYLDRGVSHLWLVDPEERSLEVMIARDGAWVLGGVFVDDETFCAPPFNEPIELGRLWRA